MAKCSKCGVEIWDNLQHRGMCPDCAGEDSGELEKVVETGGAIASLALVKQIKEKEK